MRHIEDCLFALQQRNIELRAEGDKLRFKAPAGALTDELKAELNGRREELLAWLRRQEMLEQPIPRLAGNAEVPASFAQQRLLFLEQMEAHQALYDIPAVFRIHGRLDAELLRASLRALVERHDSLRACFPNVGGQFVSRLREAYDPLQVTDLGGLDEQEKQARAAEILAAHARQRFDLAHGPLLGLHLLDLGESDGQGEQLLAFNMHHAISDGWSIGVLLREWKAIHDALAAGREAALPALPIQFNDYAAWQRQWLDRGILDAQLAYWKRQLEDLPGLLELPTDFPRPALMGFQGRHWQVQLDADLGRRVRQFSQQQGTTVFMTLLAAFNVLLHRWSGQDDIAVGSPVANRSHAQTEGLIGLFVNTLVLRSKLDRAQGFAQYLQQVRHTALDAYAQQDLPFDVLVEQLNPARSMSHSPLFQVMFALQNNHQERLALGAAELELLPPDHDIAKSDLSLSITERDGCFSCDWEYRTDLFQPETIARVAGHFEQLLRGVLAEPARPVTRVPMLTPADIQTLDAWGRIDREFPQDETVVDFFETQAARHPQRPALVFGNRQLTYAELNERANQLARHLVDRGAGPETLVGLCIERSPDMIVGLLGILKSGGAYLPLDPGYPQDRLQFMLEDSGLHILLTQAALLGRFPAQWTAAACCIDSAALDPLPRENLRRRSGPENLAYVIYTSGSTGNPKGVLIGHAALASYVRGAQGVYGIGPTDRMLQFSSLNFDASADEIYGALAHGACLVLRDAHMLGTERDFLEACGQLSLTVLPLTTAYWHQLVASNAKWPAGLRLVIIGGEAVSTRHVRQWREKGLSTTQLVNAYGPTEATIGATTCRLDAVTDPACPIGRPLAHTRVHLLDADLNLVPPGWPGELCIGGTGLARGYLNRPELTAAKFVEVELEAFGRRERIYRSGDLARWRPDGHLEYLGRIDSQVKLRGFRIELGEIENALARHPAVGEAVVTLQEHEDDRCLAAYVTVRNRPPEDLAVELRSFLRQSLPQWMMPASFTVLERLPLTPGGKVDRKALPLPDQAAPFKEVNLHPPQTTLEQQISAVWRKVLKREQVGTQDNFFDLGGHSLLLLQVLGQLRDTLGISLPVVALFQYPTIQALAAHLTGEQPGISTRAGSENAASNPDGDGGNDVAIIGMAGRFPGAANIEAFWNNLCDGVESIRFFSDDELRDSGVEPQRFQRPDYVRAGGVLEQPEYFDAAFFGYPPREAALLDPQQRLFLETAWAAMEHAGHDVRRLDCPVGVFAGAGAATYFLNNLWPNQALLAQFGPQQVLMAGDKDFIATRTAYKLDLRGPALSVSTACSTSLVAVHMARQSLLQGECRMAIAGGVSVFFPQKQGYLHQEGNILSPDGHCRAFDAEARGTVPGAGVAAVVLKRLCHALEDGDTIHAVIKGSAINNDGMAKAGFTAPSVEGQARVVTEAMRGLDFESIGYVETHGTGTVLGDPIEISALTQAWRHSTRKTGYCALGSVKTNIGHLDAAAGIAGLVKAVLALKHREIPPSLHFNQPNPQIDLAGSPFFVNAQRRAWESPRPLRAGVSSFGIGGTNAHVVLEEAPAQDSSQARPWQLLCWSAATENAWHDYRHQLGEYLSEHPASNLADVAWTFHAGRAVLPHRGFAIGRNARDMVDKLRASNAGSANVRRGREQAPSVAFIFPGQGAQYAGMGAGLYQEEAVFRAIVDECAGILQPDLGFDIREALFATDGRRDLQQTALTQPALFVVEYALARLWMRWGIQPRALAGHSIGEYVAACLAGVFSLQDALALVAMRGHLIQSLPRGDMLAVPLSEAEARPWCSDAISLAVINGPAQCVLAGSPEAIAELEARLKSKGVEGTPLKTSHAFHSHLLEPVLAPFARRLRQVELRAPRIPYVSNLTGGWVRTEEATDPDYWVRHLRHTVRFADNIGTLLQAGIDVLLETGPGRGLSSLARQHPAFPATGTALQSLPANRKTDIEAERCQLLLALGQLWQQGAAIDWKRFYAGGYRRRLPLPTYPFERQRYWIEPVGFERRQPAADISMGAADAAAAVAACAGCEISAGHRPADAGVFEAPHTPAERQLASIWESLLGIEPIGRMDDFFILGGNSLLGVQFLSRLRASLAVEISLNVLFQHPVLRDLANWLESRQGEIRTTLPPIEAQAPGAPLVLSFSQQRLRFLAQLEGDSATYSLPGVVRLAGPLDVDALRHAFATLIERHDSLRLSFPIVDGEARVVKGGIYDPVQFEEAGDVPAGLQQAFVSNWTLRHAQEPFDLATGPLLRLHVLRLNAQENILLINMHHIISDGWTIGLLIREWSILYNAAVRRQPAILPALSIQYTDYAAWQRQWLQGAVLQRQADYWKRKLAGAPELLELPADFPRPAVSSHRGGHQRLTLPEELAARLQQFSQAQGVTLFMTLLAAFKVLLYRTSGQADLLVGTPVANRSLPDTENLVGFFVNTLVLRDVLDGQADFVQLLRQVRQTALEAQDHQDIPFDYLVEQINPARSLSHAPLFQVMFALQNAPAHALALDGLQANLVESDLGSAKFDLTLSIEERGAGLACDWEYGADLFRPETVARLHAHWEILLRGILQNPGQLISRLPLLTDSDLRQLADWNDTVTEFPGLRTLADLFEAQAAATPQHAAVICGDEVLSYGELNERANRVAHRLRDWGVGPESVVGLCARRSPALLAGLFGILKAGGAYLPLDPNYPAERLAFMAEDSGANIVLSLSDVRGCLPQFTGRWLELDDAAMFAGQPTHNPVRNGSPGDAAYVIYTSGSTGKPKGVVVEQRNVTALLHGMELRSPLRRPQRGLWLGPFSFDVSVWEIFGPLCFGGSLQMLDLQSGLSPAELAEFLLERAIDGLYIPPNLLEPLVGALEARVASLDWQRLLVGVEPITQGLMQRYRRLAPGLHILNGYGPTETAVCATVHAFTSAMEPERRMPIGKPLPGYRIHVLDAALQPVPPGLPGELCIAGAGVARGYLHRPALTAEKFVEVEVLGTRERLYRSGDLARWLPNGELEYLGRVDHQVKLRGYRIEPGEIESVLAGHASVAESVVVLREKANSPFLAAYVSGKPDQPPPSPAALRSLLQAVLPEWMVPASITVLERLPQTPNGKVDRKALPEPVFAQAGDDGALRSETQRLLAALFADVLKTEVRSAAAHFFELGGHSLLAMQLVSRIRDGFGVEMPLRALFERPVLAALAAWLEQQRRGDALPPIVPLPEGAPMRLSAAQERLWFLARLEGPSPTYNMPAAVRLQGRLDVAALRRAFELLTERHQSLRMRFPEVDGEASVALLPAYDPLRVTDLAGLGRDGQAAEVRRRAQRHAVETFDLAAGPLLRLELLVLGGDEFVLLFNMHHIVADGWSMAVLLRESGASYAALAAGHEPELKPLPVQYADYAAWQREQLAGEACSRQLAWWEEQLAGAPPLLELPADHPRPPVRSHRGAHLQTRLGAELGRRLRELARRQDSTLFMTLLAAFGVLLQRHGGQDDVVVGSPVANRAHGQVEGLIGFFVNTLALRIRGEAGMPFTALLAQVRRTALEAYARQDVPFEHLVQRLSPERSLSHSPLFQAMFILQNNERAQFSWPNLVAAPVAQDFPVAKFDLTLSAEEHGDDLLLGWEYACDLFEAATVERMAQRFEVLLEGIVARPEADIHRLPLLTAEEQRQLLAWNDVAAAAPARQDTLVSRFEAQALRTPDHVAVSFGGDALSYAELNQRANRWAHALVDLGVHADTLVGLCLERSLDMVVGLLAVLKAGGAYVPLDPDYPKERLAFMLEDSAVQVLLTQGRLLESLPAHAATTLCMDGEAELARVAGLPAGNPCVELSAGHLAYVIYTSGSTGKPKGCLVTHANVTRLFDVSEPLYGFGADDVWTLFHSYAFDFSVWEIWGALLYGGRLVVVPYLTSRDPEAFHELLAQEGVTVLNQTPSAFRQLVEADRAAPSRPLALRWAIFGGEALDHAALAPWFKRHGSARPRLVNMYGITETTVHVTYCVLTGSADEAGHIGRPLADLQVWVLDAQQQPVPVGVAGEMYVGGAGVSRGYLNRPELSASRFVTLELAGRTRRLYRTGDRARQRADGGLEYLGRIDSQVKLRGFRIELGEIEEVLSQHPAVRTAVVALHEAGGHQALAAYVVGEGVEPAALRAWAGGRLPDYMVPATFTVLERLPLTANGKVDRKALPRPEAAVAAGAAQAPRTATEELLCALWSQTLKARVVDRQSHFFEIGGHSLLATQLVSRLREAFGVAFSLQQVFEMPVLAQQAAWLDGQRRGEGAASAIRPLAEGDALVMSFAQQRLWFLAQLEGQNAAYNMPIALALRGALDEPALREASAALVRRHECLRLCFPAVDGAGTVRRIEPYDPLGVIDLSGLEEGERRQALEGWLAGHGKAAFDLTRGPLFSLQLLRLAPQEQVLLFDMHHVISDGWSMGVMVRDWSELYRAAAEVREPALPALDVQYTDYAAWQKAWLHGAALQQQLAYWRTRLEGAPELLELPTDFTRPAVKTYAGRHLASTLPAELGDDIRCLGREHGATVFMTLLAAFNVLLYRYSGQEDVLVGSPIANRTQRQTEDLVGFFVNTLVLRSRLDAGQSFAELLQQVRRTALEAYAHQDIPFEYLVEQLNPNRSLSHSPLFQVMFILQNTPVGALEFDGVEVSLLEPELGTAKFDLTLSMTERDGGFICDWEYSTDLFEAETVARMAGHFEALLRRLVQAPQQPCAALSLLTPAEGRELQAWNETAFDHPRQRTLVDAFEARAATHPQRIAASFEADDISYGELNRRANQLARRLAQLGVGPDTLVGLCVERSLDMLVSLLGILKAGGAYVPMDPDYPEERLHMMLEDAAVTVLLTQQRLLERLPASAAPVLCIDRDWAEIARQGTDDLARRSGPGHLAYVIFTSGSTGRPKGVMVEHGALANFLASMGERIGIRDDDRLLAVTTLSFDIAGLELFLPLASGSRVVIVARETALDGELLKLELAERGITIMQATPATWKLLLQSGWRQRTPLTILCGGEAMPGELGRRLLENSSRLWNVYGPTETTVWSSMHDVTRHPQRPQLIGRPIGNTLIHVLDAQGCLVPPGMPGELSIGGEGLARGYLNRPELTAQKFIEVELFGQRQRLYRTGDLARWLRDGTLECLGRIDHQVKLRGFRIELGEIEETLNRHPRVREAAVTVDAAREALLAYVVPQAAAADAGAQGEQVRHWEQVWSEAYGQSSDAIEDRQRNTVGWNSSYTLEPVPEAEMKEWLDGTIERIRALQPKRVLEIGCGTGMLLFRLAPHCLHYTGADISAQALRGIERQLQDWEFGGRVTLLQAAADEIAGIEPGSVDLVIINSVIQYFPSVDYLLGVLERALALVAPGGHVFVGDVRDFRLLEAFHASVQLFQAPGEMGVAALAQRVRTGLSRERELLIHPDLFTALQQRCPGIGQVRIELKPGAAHNEMTRFRFDATLLVGAAPAQPDGPVRRLDWGRDGLDLERVKQMLAQPQADIIEIAGIPNARLAGERCLLDQLAKAVSPGATTAGLKALVATHAGDGVDPQSLQALAQGGAFACSLYHGDGFHFTAVLQRPAPGVARHAVVAGPAAPRRDWRTYANVPALGLSDTAALVGELREHLQQRLPAYMVPGSFTVLERLPLTPNGKIDRKALPAPDAQRRDTAALAPRDALELQLARLWEELLQVQPVGVRDNFFELGGHSLLAVRLVAQIGRRLGQRIALATLFHHATIEALARVLRQQVGPRAAACLVPIQPGGSAAPLFCVHPAGGNVLCYLELAQQLGADQPVYAFQARGLEDALAPRTEVADMARAYIDAMQAVQPRGPYRLAGWSFGGVVAVEMAAQLQARHESVSFLGLLDAIAPQVLRGRQAEPQDDAAFFAGYFAEAGAMLPLERLRALDPEQQLVLVTEEGRRQGLFPADVEAEQMRALVRVYRANMGAALRHEASVVHGGITLFQATERRAEDPCLPADHGWQACATGPVEVVRVPGMHHTMVRLPHVRGLAQRLRADLERLPGRTAVAQDGLARRAPGDRAMADSAATA